MAQSLRLAVYGFDDRSRETLRLAFDGPGKGCGVLVEEALADAAIFNMDAVNSQELWADYSQRFPGRPTIIMAIKNPGIEGTFFVPKPVRIDAMLKAVDLVRGAENVSTEVVEDRVFAAAAQSGSVSQSWANKSSESPLSSDEKKTTDRAESAPKAEVPSSDLKDHVVKPQKKTSSPSPGIEPALSATAKEQAETYYDPHDLLQGQIHGALDQANKKYVAVQLTVQMGDDDWQSITFLPGVKRVLTTLSDEQLKHLCTTPLYLLNCSIRRHKGDETFNMIRKVTDEKSGQSLDVFLWKVAVWTSLGRVPVGTVLSAPVKIKHWPNLTRFYPIPNAMRIATLIIDQPRPLSLIVKVLNLPQSHVFAFYSAAYAISLISSDTGAVGVPVAVAEQVAPKKHKHHSLFGRILKRLRGG